MLNKIKLRGYSLIELMVVLAITAGLATAAVSQYKSYAMDTKFAGVLLVMESLKPQIEAYIHDKNSIPINGTNNSNALTSKLSSPYVTVFTWEGINGIAAVTNAIAIGYNNTNSGSDKIYLVPHPNTGNVNNWTHIVWTCANFGSRLTPYLPSNCNDTGPTSEWPEA